MNNINKTLYIPLYGKAYVSKKGIILKDKKAEQIWAMEGFSLKGKSKSKWLAYYMGMRSAVFDEWVLMQMKRFPDSVIIHLGCGMDSRVERIGTFGHKWYDIDFPSVIEERKRYFEPYSDYVMIGSDVRDEKWLNDIARKKTAIIVMEGISMYLTFDELITLLRRISTQFEHVHLLMDCYTTFAAKATKYKNPINDVGVMEVHGIDDPFVFELESGFHFIKEHDLTPLKMIDELHGIERLIFKYLFAGPISKRMYRLYEFQSKGVLFDNDMSDNETE